MRYMLGIIHLAKMPTTFRKAEWENPEKRNSVMQIWLEKSGYFNVEPSDILHFRRELLTLILKLKEIHDEMAPTDIEEAQDSADDDVEVLMIPPTT